MSQPVAGPHAPVARSGGLPPWLRWVALGCGCLVFLAVAIGIGAFFVLQKATAAPQKVVQDFLAATAAGDYATAHGYFSQPLQQRQGLEQFSALARANPALFQVEDTTFTERSVDMKKASFSGTLTLAGGTAVPASFELVREDGEWRLLAYQIGS